MQEQKRQKMNTGDILRKFFPSECVDKILDVADYQRYEAMEYWKEISKQSKVNRFPMKKQADVISWGGWVGDKPEYIIGLCHNCASPCSIYNEKIFINIDEHGQHEWCSHKCMMDGESWTYAKHEKMKYKYAYDYF